MSQSAAIVVMLAVLIPLWYRLSKDFVGGLAYAVFILLTFTTLLRIETPGLLPELTIHRLVIISLFLWWWWKPANRSVREVPLSGLLFLWAACAFISLLGSIDLGNSIKRYLDFVIELFLFYFIVATTVSTREDGFRLLRAAVLGLSVVALLAIIEKQTGFNVVDHFFGADNEAVLARDVRATYRHRILLGAGMAMGWPLALAVRLMTTGKLRRAIGALSVGALFTGCYYAMSRGPWLAAVLAGLLLVWFGTRAVRKPMILVGTLAILVLVSRPGVLTTLSGFMSATADKESFKGGTFQYRLELWLVAFESIKTSPGRFLFGFGPGSAANQSIDWTLSYRGKDFQIESWDNDFAYALFQYGVLGLASTLLLYGSIAWRLFKTARGTTGMDRDVYLCLCASALILFFMMSNVHIFARQLYYLLWTVAAVGLVAFRPGP